jgi:hypothetical protein
LTVAIPVLGFHGRAKCHSSKPPAIKESTVSPYAGIKNEKGRRRPPARILRIEEAACGQSVQVAQVNLRENDLDDRTVHNVFETLNMLLRKRGIFIAGTS